MTAKPRVVPPAGYGYCFTYAVSGYLMRLTLLLSLGLLAACASHAPLATAPDRWTYLGNDPEGTQNIYMRGEGSDKKQDTVTAWYKFEFASPHEVVTGPALKQQVYIERRDLVEVDCKAETLRLKDETYFNVEDQQVFRVTPDAAAVPAAQVFAGGVSDIVYEGACGSSLQWTSLGEDAQKTQDIYARVESQADPNSIVKARFRFVYHEPRTMVAAPSLTQVSYTSSQSSVFMDCANQTFALEHQTYYDEDGVTVFGITPPKGAKPSAVAPDGVTGLMYKAACGIPLTWTYVGMDPRKTQKIYLVGEPDKKSGGTVEAKFRFEYLAPGKLVTGANLTQVEYTVRTADVLLDCGASTLTLLRESYQDDAQKEVFSVKPAAPQPAPVAPQGLTGMMQHAACHP